MMLPGTAKARPGQFRKLGSVTFTRVIAPRASVCTQCRHGPRQLSAQPRAAEDGGSAKGALTRVKVTDPSFRNWPGLAHAVPGNIIPDFPVINKSFNLSYSGNDR